MWMTELLCLYVSHGLSELQRLLTHAIRLMLYALLALPLRRLNGAGQLCFVQHRAIGSCISAAPRGPRNKQYMGMLKKK